MAATSSRRLPRGQRREQLLAAATRVFAHAGFAAAGLDDVAAAGGVTRAILYRHFQSKHDLYRAVLQRARRRLQDAVGPPPYTERIIDDLLSAAAADPDGFRVLFHQAGREPEFRADVDAFQADMTANAHAQMASTISDPSWTTWAASLAPVVTIAAITAWLDAGQPQPETAARRIRHVAGSISAAATGATGQVLEDITTQTTTSPIR